MLLQKYLRKYSIEKLSEQYAIKTRRHTDYPNLILFKYNMITKCLIMTIINFSDKCNLTYWISNS